MNASVSTGMGSGGAAQELFALTDEQILEIEPAEWVTTDGISGTRLGESDDEVLRGANDAPLRMTSLEGEPNRRKAGHNDAGNDGKGAEPGAQEPPKWLAERMRDPWHGDEARELWEGAVRAQQEAAAYRAAIASPEEARALKEIYPGGVNEAKAAAERARQLEEIDGAFYRGDATARAQLAQRMMEQDPGAFREMVAAGVRLLEAAGREVASADEGKRAAHASNIRAEPVTARDDGNAPAVANRGWKSAQAQVAVARETVSEYAGFEKAANEELERSVGGAIARTMEQALPNLKRAGGLGREGAQSTPLQERLAGAVREEIDAALKNDAQLGEQVGKILAGRRFDEATRAQVVRLIDARAQQLVPGAVKRVVGAWTQATIGARTRNAKEGPERRDLTPANGGVARTEGGRQDSLIGRGEAGRGRRVDYGKMSDAQILDL